MDTSVGGTLTDGTVQLVRHGKFHPCLLHCFSDTDVRLLWLTCECPSSNFIDNRRYVTLLRGREQVNCGTAHRWRTRDR
jgi:hypothetical protein